MSNSNIIFTSEEKKKVKSYFAKQTLTTEEASQILGVSPQTMREIAHRPGFPMITNGRKILIPREAFMHWLNDPHYSYDPR